MGETLRERIERETRALYAIAEELVASEHEVYAAGIFMATAEIRRLIAEAEGEPRKPVRGRDLTVMPGLLQAAENARDVLRSMRDNGPGLIAQHGDVLDMLNVAIARADDLAARNALYAGRPHD